MHRWTLARVMFAFSWPLAISSMGWGGESRSPTVENSAAAADSRVRISNLIDSLGDPDPSVRAAAADQLVAAGAAARAALLEAMDSEGPEVRAQVSKILLQLPWALPGDSDLMKQLLGNYGELSVADRVERVVGLGRLPAGNGQPALLRILQDDPSAAVRWTAAQSLRTEHDGNKPPMAQLRAISTEAKEPAARRMLANNAPLLAAVGWAWRDVDIDRADGLLKQAVAIEQKHPGAIHGEMDFVFVWLFERAMEQQHYTEAAAILREQAMAASPDDEQAPGPVAQLMALHAEHGPLEHFRDDLKANQRWLNDPRVIYSFSRLASRWDHPVVATLLDGAAMAMSGGSEDQHADAGGFLADQGWDSAAERELQIAIALANGSTANEYFQLARIASGRNDELAVAQNLEAALRQIGDGEHVLRRSTRFGDVLPWTTEDGWAEVHWHYLRAARNANDLAAVQTHLEKLMELDRLGQILHKDPGLATDIVPALQETGRKEDAKKCFDAAYQDLHHAIEEDPTNAEAKNNLAWLCARCGERLDEAIKWSDEAVAAVPGNAAYLDTSAEAHFRSGLANDAVRLETKALQLRPTDQFMKSQLDRFERAREKPQQMK